MTLREARLAFEVAGVLSTINLPHCRTQIPPICSLASSAKVFGLTLVTSDRNLIHTGTLWCSKIDCKIVYSRSIVTDFTTASFSGLS